MKSVAAFAVLALLLQSCCSCPQSAESPNGAEAAPSADAEASAAPTANPEPAPTPAPAAEPAAVAPPKEEPKPAKPAVAEPVFTDGMSVADAIKAVPQGAERSNIDQETLAIPIQNPDVYEPCKPGPVRIKLKIAVWDGKAVGLDVTATPKNDKVAACVREQILKLSWKARVKSLNIVEYSF